MGKISLIIADNDNDYITKLEKFLIINYPHRFDIFSFSSYEKLSDYLDNSDKKDILLINYKMYRTELSKENIGNIIFLTECRTEHIEDGYFDIVKYQHAEKLVTEMVRIYTSDCMRDCLLTGSSSAKLLCICSPSGGTGKTSIAAGLSILCAGRGLKTFYLNLEKVPSTSLFFSSENEQSNFSNVIYYLKGKSGNLGLQLEGVKACDLRSGVNFFLPPDNILEMEELTVQDINCLLSYFKNSAPYDIVIVDLSSGLDKCTAAVMEAVDKTLLVTVPGENTEIRVNALKAGLDILERKYGMGLENKITTVLNKCAKMREDISTPALIGSGFIAEIGDYSDYTQSGKKHCRKLTENIAYMSDLNGLLESFLLKETVSFTEVDGGEAVV